MLKTANKPLFVEISDYSFLVARVSATSGRIQVESLLELPTDIAPEQATESILQFSSTKKGQLCLSVCGMYPPQALLRRTTLESPNKAKDPAYLIDFVKQQFKIDVESHAIFPLNAALGTPFQPEKLAGKELIFCGAPKAAILAEQERLLSYNLYPERLELGTLATLGGMMRYNRLKGIKAPTLMLEITETQAQVLIFQGDQLDVARPIPYGLSSMYPLVQQELGLKDEDSARKLFSSNTFDFTEMGPVLLKKMLKELQASTGFYEVQTGQTIGQIYLNLLPENLNWVGRSLSRTLGVDVIEPDLATWLEGSNITLADGVETSKLDKRWFGLFALMCDYNPQAEAADAKGK